MKRTIALLCTAVLTAGLLSGCVTRAEEPAAGTSETESQTVDAATAEATELNENELNIYTALEDDQLTDYLEEFRELYPDVQINITRDSTGIITSRLLAEKDNPVADVVWGLSATSLLVLEQEGMLEPYAPEGVERVLPEFKDSAEVPTWVGIDAWETAFLVNKEVLQSKGIDTVPQSYADLLDPRYKGLIAMSNPASSGTGLLTVNGILQLMGEEEGWNYLDQLNENVAVYLHSGSQPAKATAAGEYGIGVSFGYRCIKSAAEVGSDIAEVVFPEEGSGWDIEANALIKKDGIKEISKTFLDWAITDNIMEKYAKGYPIVSIGFDEGEIPEGYEKNPLEQLIPMDFGKAAAEREDILTEWTNRYDGKSAPKE